MKKLILGFILSAMVLNSSAAMAHGKTRPAGFDEFFVFMANGVFDPNNPTPGRGAVDCSGLFCDGTSFQRDVMKRDANEIADRAQMAKDFFNRRFGVDVDAPEMADRVIFKSFMTNPDWDYRMYVKGRKTKAKGWEVRDGGFYALITDPQGFTLGGEFEGDFAPANTILFFGEYNVLMNKRKNKELLFEFQSRFIHTINEDGSATFRCELFNEEFGDGYAIVSTDNFTREDGMVQGRGRGRNVLTFPAYITTVEGQKVDQ
jgi:hypothetical protein